MSEQPLVQALSTQARICQSMGSAFSAALLDHAAADLARGGPTERLFAPWAGADAVAIFKDAAQLRFLGALHERALSGGAIAAFYPAAGGPGAADAAWREALALIGGDFERLAAFMTHEPQTNETRRSVCLLGGFLTVAAETGLPLSLFELGASAGLNQLWDRYRYDLGPAGAWGDPASPVAMDTAWTGGPPPLDAAVRVAARAACDRKPVDLTDPAQRLRLKAYIWPDQLERLARLDAAVTMALGAGTQVEAEDAVVFAAARAAPRDGVATVLFHSVFWQYMPPASQDALRRVIADLGDAATAQAPFAWLRMEPAPTSMAVMEISLTLWPTGEDRILGRCHPHGASVEWLA